MAVLRHFRPAVCADILVIAVLAIIIILFKVYFYSLFTRDAAAADAAARWAA